MYKGSSTNIGPHVGVLYKFDSGGTICSVNDGHQVHYIFSGAQENGSTLATMTNYTQAENTYTINDIPADGGDF